RQASAAPQPAEWSVHRSWKSSGWSLPEGRLSRWQHHPHPVIPVLVTGIKQRHVDGAQDSSLTAPTRRGWIPVTSTGMTVEKAGLSSIGCRWLAPHPPAGTFSPPEGRRVRVRGLCSPAEGL